jgi:hypothetical protein
MKSMNQRRTGQRITMGLPVEIRWTSRSGSPKQAIGRTGNISGNGLFIEIPVRLQRETAFTMRVELPRRPTQGALELLCQGRVVRWNRRGEVQGLGAVIDEYELKPLPQVATGKKVAAPKIAAKKVAVKKSSTKKKSAVKKSR